MNSIAGSQSGYASPSEEVSYKGSLLVGQNLSDFGIRGTISYFGGCCCSSSVARGAQREENSISQAICFIHKIANISLKETTRIISE